MKYIPFGKKKRDERYKLIDPFCIFYLEFVSKQKKINEKFWQQNVTSSKINSWRGFAFENVCFNHVEQIKNGLKIQGVQSNASPWYNNDEGVQIDMLIERNDNIVDICEMKYYSDDFLITKEYYKQILKRQTIIQSLVSKKVAVHNVLVTTFGLSHNEYEQAFTHVITLDDLFVSL